MAVQTESPTLGRGTDWNSFYGTEPLEANDPFSPSAFGQLLFAEPDAASARGLLGIADALLDLTFADIGGTIGLDQLPPGSVASLDSIDQDALYFFNNTTGLPELISNAETVAFISPALNFSDIQGNLSIEQFPPGSVVTIDSIDEDALYFFDNTLFQPRLINAADTLTFLGITGGGSFLSANTARVDPSGNDSTGTIGDLGKPFATIQALCDQAVGLSLDGITILIGNYGTNENVTTSLGTVTFVGNGQGGNIAFSSFTSTNSGGGVALTLTDIYTGSVAATNTSNQLQLLLCNAEMSNVTNSGGSVRISGDTGLNSVDDVTAAGNITAYGLNHAHAFSAPGFNIDLTNILPGLSNSGQYLLPSINSAGSAVNAKLCLLGDVTCGELTLIDSRVAGTNNATSTVYADVLLAGDDTAYNATSWNGDMRTPTKNALRDKFESLSFGSGDVVGPSSSVDSEVALFNSTTGKLIKRATGSGLAVLTSGVLSTTTNNSSNWDTAFTERAQWNGGATNLVAATGRTSLGLVIGTNVQAWDADLDTLAGLTATTNNFIVSVGSAWASRTPTQVKSTLAIANTDVSGLGTASTLASDTDGTLATNSDSRIATQKAVKTYIDGINTALLAAIAALDSKDEVAYCSTSALPTCNYSNGSSGVGATLTATTNGPLIIDGVTTVLGAQGLGILVAGQASDFQNGWYTLTQQGVVAVSPWILTRRTPDDQAAEIGPGYLTAVEAPIGLTAGSNNQKVFLSISPVPFVVGTDSLTFAMVGGTYTAGNGLSLSGTALSINTSITADLSTAQSLLNKKLGSLTSNGFVKTGGGDGTLSVDTASYQPLDSDLTTLAGLTATTDNFIVSVSNAWASRTPSQVRTTLGLVIGTNVQAWDVDLDTWAGVTPGTGIATFLATPSSANLKTAITDETGSGGALVFATSPTLATPDFTTGFTIGTAATSRKMAVGNGTNFVASTETWATPSTTGNILTSDGTNWTSAVNHGGWTEFYVSGSNATTTGQSLVDITGLTSGTLSNSTLYEIEANLSCLTSNDATGIKFAVHAGGSGTAATASGVVLGTAGSLNAQITTSNLSTIDTATVAFFTLANVSGGLFIRGFVTTRSTGIATISIQFLKTTSGTATVNIGSVFRYRLAGQ